MALNAPVTPDQPLERRYPVEALYLCPRLTRATYREKFGQEPPPYDPKRRIQRFFFDSYLEGSASPETEVVNFAVVVNGVMSSLTMTKADLATPNLPGAVVYPKYSILPTKAVMMDMLGGSSPLNADTLLAPQLAELIAGEIRKDLGVTVRVVVKPADEFWPFRIIWNGETRRQVEFEITKADGSETVTMDAAALARSRYAKGIGCPGKWTWPVGHYMTFVPEIPNEGTQDLRPEVPMPCRPLLQGETLEHSPFGTVVLRTDLVPPDQPAPGTGVLTQEQHARLLRIERAVVRG